MNGAGIWLHFLNASDGDEAKADKTAALYGATRHKGRWGRAIGIIENDRCARYRCPDCHKEWSR